MDSLAVLKKYFGFSSFREGQKDIIENILAKRDVLGVLPTGAGKSLCYQIPAVIFEGITLVISPLISLMHDQVMALNQAGIPAAYINSTLSPKQTAEALRRAQLYRYKIIYVAPERLFAPSFLQLCSKVNISFVAVDEGHCVSQWGQDFRPSYLKIKSFISSFKQRPVLAAFTATATSIVKQDIITFLGLQCPFVLTTGFDRPNLYFEVRKPKDKDEELMRILKKWDGNSGIIYCATRKNVDKVCDLLRNNGIKAARYHAGLSDDERKIAQEDFQFDRAPIMVATNAFGMGIDKSNVHFVVHYNMPKDLESYYQEAGRAGRDGEPADCILLYSKQDVHIAKFLIQNCKQSESTSIAQQNELIKNQEERLKQMTFYATTPYCLRSFILRYFGEKTYEKCGHCSSCTGLQVLPSLKKTTQCIENDLELVFAALRHLRNLIAIENQIPAYIIFHDRTLRDMAEKMPLDLEGFSKVSGVGEKKVKEYGEVFISLIKQVKNIISSGEKFSVKEMQETAALIFNNLKPWSDQEILRLRVEKAQKMSIDSISKLHKRPVSAIEEMLQRLI
ncbi:MAG: RecQ family ATP-dependent DNA helicase [Eubacteriales bacterium]|nr:RecQ family ATP-dependent DNA helicase [Eubacteriales bacterium]